MSAFTEDFMPEQITPICANVEEGQRIVIPANGWKRAFNLRNRLIANIEAHEDEQTLRDYWEAEEPLIEALAAFDFDIHLEVQEFYQFHMSCITRDMGAQP